MIQTPLSTNDFDYLLPDELIARYPLETRSQSRLLHVHGDIFTDRQFADLPSLLNAGDLLVLNDTKVMKARLFGTKPTGGKLEALVERILPDVSALPTSAQLDDAVFAEYGTTYPYLALCHIKASKAPKAGQWLIFGDIKNDDATNHAPCLHLWTLGQFIYCGFCRADFANIRAFWRVAHSALF